jgi:alginate O-acetyltransferase complex protein AlgJ
MSDAFRSPHDLAGSAAGQATNGVDVRRRRLLFALGAAPLAAGGLSLLPRGAYAAPASTVIEGRDRWLFPGWESLTIDDTPACLKVLDLIHATTGRLTARGIRSVIVIAPLKARSCEAKLPDGIMLSAAVKARYAALCAHGKDVGLDIVDGDAALATVNPDDDSTFIRADYHWSGHAAEANAAAVAKRLLADGGFKGQAGGASKLGDWNEEVHYGDLAELLSPEKKKAIGKDHFIVRQVVGGEELVDGAAPVVQVVGNSMVQPYLGFPQKLSSAIGRPVGLTWTFGNTGPWKTLLNYLETPAFKAQTPQAIVWQFNEGQMMNAPGAAGQWDAASVMPDDAWLARIEKALG